MNRSFVRAIACVDGALAVLRCPWMGAVEPERGVVRERINALLDMRSELMRLRDVAAGGNANCNKITDTEYVYRED